MKKAMEDFAALATEHRDAISCSLMEDEILCAQMAQFVSEEEKPLHTYPDLFVALRARAFALCTERRTEGEHAQVKVVSVRGFRYAGPVVIAARKRRN